MYFFLPTETFTLGVWLLTEGQTTQNRHGNVFQLIFAECPFFSDILNGWKVTNTFLYTIRLIHITSSLMKWFGESNRALCTYIIV